MSVLAESLVKRGGPRGSEVREMYMGAFMLKKKFGADNVFDLSIMNPVMEPPKEFFDELKRLADNPVKGAHRYMMHPGFHETRVAVAEQIKAETGIDISFENITITSGCSSSLSVTFKVLLNPGEEVVIFTPFWGGYRNYVTSYGGVPKIIPTNEEFMPDLDLLEKTLSPKTKAVVINSPNNPSGAVIDEDTLAKMGELLGQKEKEYGTTIFLVSDQVYSKIMFDGKKFPQPMKYQPNTIIVTSHSKDLSLAGERIGHIAVNPESEHAKKLGNFLGNSLRSGGNNASALMQRIVSKLQNVS
ncbi:MAG: aminotransferase class I/II-fold pyridoxal phosphate-dependent enzyme, partial [Deltaproteobacteria bacterium]|nr:aminotransferase class I/II-fold pyridoxal phosphate-dependent enzyme [Deltaproteobacteria bacterium]